MQFFSASHVYATKKRKAQAAWFSRDADVDLPESGNSGPIGSRKEKETPWFNRDPQEEQLLLRDADGREDANTAVAAGLVEAALFFLKTPDPGLYTGGWPRKLGLALSRLGYAPGKH